MTWVSLGIGVGTAGLGISKEKKAERREGAQAQLEAGYERERDQRDTATRQRIDMAYDSPQRAGQVNQFAAALRQYLGNELAKKKVDTSRNLKFALAKQGLTGGSVAKDSGRRLGDEFVDASIGNERSVQGALADVRGQDEQARAALKSMAGSGVGLTDASRRASTAQAQNLATADFTARGRGLGDIFADTANTYKTINERAALRKGYGYSANRADLYGGRP